jgi:AcrR family transcriptional regulator
MSNRAENSPSRLPDTAARKAAVISAALKLFANKGFAATRMSDVAEMAGVAKGTVYLYFPSKEALFEGILVQTIGPSVEALNIGEQEPGEPLQAFLRRWLMAIVTGLAHSDRADVIHLLLSEGTRFPRLAAIYYRVVIEPGLQRIERALREAAARGEIRSSALLQFPQLVVAPLLLGVIWTKMFSDFRTLDLEAMMNAHIDSIFDR